MCAETIPKPSLSSLCNASTRVFQLEGGRATVLIPENMDSSVLEVRRLLPELMASLISHITSSLSLLHSPSLEKPDSVPIKPPKIPQPPLPHPHAPAPARFLSHKLPLQPPRPLVLKARKALLPRSRPSVPKIRPWATSTLVRIPYHPSSTRSSINHMTTNGEIHLDVSLFHLQKKTFNASKITHAERTTYGILLRGPTAKNPKRRRLMYSKVTGRSPRMLFL